MKTNRLVFSLLLCLGFAFTFSSCDEMNKEKAVVSFGANYNIANCMSTVAVYLDDDFLGTLESAVDTILDCYDEGTITKEITVGDHAYRIEILSDSGCITKELKGEFTVFENECKKIFIDYRNLDGKASGSSQDVIISPEEYENAIQSSLFIDSISLSGNYLNIRFYASGCSGDSWIVKLIDSGVVLESDPCRRNLILSLENNEMCEAYIGKEVSFNIRELRIPGTQGVVLNITPGNHVFHISGDTIPSVPQDTIPYIPQDTIPYIPGDTIPYIPGDSIPYVPGDSVPYIPQDTVPYIPQDTIPNNPGDTIY